MKLNKILFALVIFGAILILLSSFSGSIRFLTVLGGSMSPKINMGDLVVTRRVNPNEIRVNDIIAFNDKGKNVVVTHRVVNVTEQGFITKGDANEDPDSRIVTQREVIGKVQLNLPLLGYFFYYSKTLVGLVLLIIIPGILIIIGEVKNILKYRKGKPKESVYLLLPLILLSSITAIVATNAYFSDAETSVGNTFTAWVAPVIPANISIEPIDDSFVKSVTPNKNYGDKKIIMVVNIKDKIIDYGFLKFDLSELPDDADISYAEVYMYGLGASFGKDFGCLSAQDFKPDKCKSAHVSMLFVQDDSWDEDTITWKNKPDAGEILDTASVRKPEWYGWDVTSRARDEFKSDKKLSLMMSTDSGIAIFFSKESKKKPYLLIEYTSADPVNTEPDVDEEGSSIEDLFIQELQGIPWDNAENENATESSGGGNGDTGFPRQNPNESNATQNCTEAWNCTGWSSCVNGTQTRNCTDLNACNTTLEKPAEFQECNITEINQTNSTQNCAELWNCTEWSECADGVQNRTCTDSNACNTTANKPEEMRECNSTSNETCIEEWICNEWSECTNGTQSRNCSDVNNCNTTINKPTEIQSCDIITTTTSSSTTTTIEETTTTIPEDTTTSTTTSTVETTSTIEETTTISE